MRARPGVVTYPAAGRLPPNIAMLGSLPWEIGERRSSRPHQDRPDARPRRHRHRHRVANVGHASLRESESRSFLPYLVLRRPAPQGERLTSKNNNARSVRGLLTSTVLFAILFFFLSRPKLDTFLICISFPGSNNKWQEQHHRPHPRRRPRASVVRGYVSKLRYPK